MLPVIIFPATRMNDIPLLSSGHVVAAEMNSNLTDKGIDTAEGFVITAEAFKIFRRENNLQLPLAKILQELDTEKFSNIVKIGKAARQLILNNELPHKLETEIRNAHYALCGEETNVCVTIRSSATAEDLPVCGFTQQLESFVNIEGEDALINAVHKCFASVFSERAIYDRHHKGINNEDMTISIAVEKMKCTKCSSSNEAFPIDPLKSFDKIMSFKTVENA